MGSCDLCGSENKLIRAEIEGVLLNVCDSCGKHGNVLGEVPKKVIIPVKKKIIREVIEESIVSSFSDIIKQSRIEKELKQEDFAKLLNERESLVHKWENGILTPSIDTAKKIGKLLGINLIERVKESKIELDKIESGAMTLGDVIKIKKR